MSDIQKIAITIDNHTLSAELTPDELELVIESIRRILAAAQSRSLRKTNKKGIPQCSQ